MKMYDFSWAGPLGPGVFGPFQHLNPACHLMQLARRLAQLVRPVIEIPKGNGIEPGSCLPTLFFRNEM